MGAHKIPEAEFKRRLAFLRGKGLEKSVIKFWEKEGMHVPIETMEESFGFFHAIGSNPARIFKHRPRLLAHHNIRLMRKLIFFVYTIGISQKKLVRTEDLYSLSLDSMNYTYQHFVKLFGNEEQAKELFRNSPSVFGNNPSLIDDKIRAYNANHIDFRRNYSLLELSPSKVIDTRNYLDEIGVEEPERGKWYHMLLGVSRETIKSKIDYCKKEGINWRNYPRILLLGLGTDKKLGALPRRVNLIKNAFTGVSIPDALDYKNKPLVLDDYDEEIRKSIYYHKGKAYPI